MSRRCPRCAVDFEVMKKTFAEIDLCPRCGGLFLDRGEGTSLHGADSDASFLVEDGRAQLVRPSELVCPSEAHPPTTMHVYAVGFEEDTVEFEHCPACKGVFLDHGEDEALEAKEGSEVSTATGARFSAPPPVDRQAIAVELARAEKERGFFGGFFLHLVQGTAEVLRDTRGWGRRRRRR